MSRLESLYIKLGEPDGEMPGCCETADWAAGYIEELQSELMEQCRLLGMSAERELKLRTEIERQKARYALLEESYSLLRTEIEAMRGKINELHAEIEATRKQEPVGTAFLCDRCKTPLDGAHFCPGCGWCMATEEPVYLAPGAPSVLDEIELLRTNAERYEWLRAQHRPVDLPIAQVVWKRNSDPHGEWVNLADDNDLDRHIDAMLLLTDQGDK